jgi:hypothetical protein
MTYWYMASPTGLGIGPRSGHKPVSCCLVLFFGCAVCLAQQSTATILGTIADPTGAAVPGVRVTLTNEGTRDNRDTLPDNLGDYRFAFVPPGTYSIKAEVKSFRVSTVEHLVLRVNDERRQDITLQVGTITESVSVTASPVNALIGSAMETFPLASGTETCGSALPALLCRPSEPMGTKARTKWMGLHIMNLTSP